MKKIAVLLFLLFPLFAFSQGRLVYYYDGAGNRSARVVNIYRSMLNLEEEDDLQEKNIWEEEIREEGLQRRKIRVSPNPTEGKLKVTLDRFETEDKCTMELYSVDGMLINSIKAEKVSTTLDITSRPSGIYLLHIKINGKETVLKIIKK